MGHKCCTLSSNEQQSEVQYQRIIKRRKDNLILPDIDKTSILISKVTKIQKAFRRYLKIKIAFNSEIQIECEIDKNSSLELYQSDNDFQRHPISKRRQYHKHQEENIDDSSESFHDEKTSSNNKFEINKCSYEFMENENRKKFFFARKIILESNEVESKMIKIKWNDGSTYTGEWKNGKANGKGIFVHADKSVFEGYFINDKANGFGKYTLANRGSCEGIWKDDQLNGPGFIIRKGNSPKWLNI